MGWRCWPFENGRDLGPQRGQVTLQRVGKPSWGECVPKETEPPTTVRNQQERGNVLSGRRSGHPLESEERDTSAPAILSGRCSRSALILGTDSKGRGCVCVFAALAHMWRPFSLMCSLDIGLNHEPTPHSLVANERITVVLKSQLFLSNVLETEQTSCKVYCCDVFRSHQKSLQLLP